MKTCQRIWYTDILSEVLHTSYLYLWFNCTICDLRHLHIVHNSTTVPCTPATAQVYVTKTTLPTMWRTRVPRWLFLTPGSLQSCTARRIHANVILEYKPCTQRARVMSIQSAIIVVRRCAYSTNRLVPGRTLLARRMVTTIRHFTNTIV